MSFSKVIGDIGKVFKSEPVLKAMNKDGSKLKAVRTGQGKVLKKVTNTGNTGTAAAPAVNVKAEQAASTERTEDMKQRLKKAAALGSGGGGGTMDSMKKSLLGE